MAGAFVHQYWLVRLFKGTAQAQLKKLVQQPARSRVNWVAEGILGGGAASIAIGGVRKGEEASFNFGFTVDNNSLALSKIEVLNDGSVGSTRWAFDISADGRRIFSIPTHRFDDAGKPSVCLSQPAEGLKASLPTKLPAKIRIEGFRGEDF